jgi:hypothetical protein
MFLHFVSLERRGRAVSVVGWAWAILVIDAGTNPGFDRGIGLLHPQVGNLSFRLPELVLVAALAARVAVRGLPTSVAPAMLAWAAFAAWYLGAGVAGILAGHEMELVFFEAKVVLYLLGGIALAAGVPATEHLAYLPTLLRRAAFAALVLVLLDQSGVAITANFPLMPVDNLGEIGGDAASIFVSLGVITLVVGASQQTQRLQWLLVGTPLVLTPFTTEQRAALLGLALSVITVAVAWMRPGGHRGMHVTPTELGLVGLMLILFLTLPSVGSAVIEQRPAPTPFSDELRVAFEGQEKVQSAESRRNQWDKAREIIGRSPVVGKGLGTEYRYYEQGPDEIWQSNLTHNVPLDVMMRSGVTGFVLLVVALSVSIIGGLRAIRQRSSPQVVALALACVAVIVGLAGKGLVESIFEKYLLATAIGLVLGTMRSCDTQDEGAGYRRAVARPWEVSWS